MTKPTKLFLAISLAISSLTACGGSSNTAIPISSSSETTTSNSVDTLTTVLETKTGYFIDAEVRGMEYQTSSNLKGKTNSLGQFFYKEGDNVTFHIGQLEIGSAKPDAAGLITPKGLSLNAAPEDQDKAKEIELLLLRLLQSLDVDENPENGITINPRLVNVLATADTTAVADSSELSLLNYNNDLRAEIDKNDDGLIDVDSDKAETHASNSLADWNNGIRPDHNNQDNHENNNGNQAENGLEAVDTQDNEVVGEDIENDQSAGADLNEGDLTENEGEDSSGLSQSDDRVDQSGSEVTESEIQGAGNTENNQTDHVADEQAEGNNPDGEQNHTDAPVNTDDSGALSLITNDQKYSLAYMWNEERLAKDIYLALNDVYPTKQFENIATKSEQKHIDAVEGLVAKYDININNLVDYTVEYSEAELRAMPAGTYGVESVQKLYDDLYAKGIQSKVDALQVACMVEVVDVDDLDKFIEVAEKVNATDLVSVFTNLRAGSYNHYWAFDSALKAEGVSDGCASLGAEYAKTPEEFPSSQGGGRGK